jgi:thymidylate synthase (FAD)
MGRLVSPKVYFIGETGILYDGMIEYLIDSGNGDFLATMEEAHDKGLSDGEILCSFYGKLCYASLTLDKNKNITRIRDIQGNLEGIFNSGHGSVLEHCYLNFVICNCSRVLTHELVRHRVGTSFSQTSGRYVRGDSVDIVFDPILDPVREDVIELQGIIEDRYNKMVIKLGLPEMKDFAEKKKKTSALRRVLPNGQSNEIGFGLNLRTLRHIVQLRTSRHSEWEIRQIFAQVYNLVKAKYPMIFYGAKEEIVDGLIEVSGMKLQPHEKVNE